MLAVLLSITVGSPIVTAAVSTAPAVGDITVTNNKEGTNDTVVVTNVTSGDIITVYPTSTSISALGNAVASGTSATITLSQLGRTGGTVYVTKLTSGNTESTRTAKTYSAEPVSTAPVVANVSVTNNYQSTPDTVNVSGLANGDVVKVYATSSSTTALGTATSSGSSVTVSIPQIGVKAGTAYVSITSTNKWESPKTAVTYGAEPVATAPALADVAVTNNYQGTSDTIVVSNVASGDLVKVYATNTSTTALGSATASGTSVTVSVSQIGTAAGTLYVSKKTTTEQESTRTAVTFTAEPVTTAPAGADLSVTNNPTGTADTVAVANVTSGDVVKVYATSSSTTALGTATASGTTVTVTVGQVGTAAGSVYVTKKNSTKHESPRTAVSFSAEQVSTAPIAADITVTNNYQGTADTVVVANVVSGDVVKVYATNTATTALGSATSTGTSVTVSIPQVGTGAGSVYVSLKNASKNESTRTAATFIAEPVTTAPLAADITVTNNPTGTADTVAVANVVSGDVVKVYATSTSTTALGTATASGTSVTVSVPQLGTAAGTVYVTKKNASKHESPRTSQSFTAEGNSTAPAVADITVTNNYQGTADTVAVANVVSGDIVKVYANNTTTTALGTATSSGTTVTVSVPQVGTGAGSVYVSVKNAGKNESTRTAAAFIAEPITTAPVAADITVTNNPTGTADTVAVANVVSGDVVKVYATSTATTALGTATATGTSVTVSVPQLGTGTGTVYVTVKNATKHESPRTSQTFAAEGLTTAPNVADITVTNNYQGTADTVVVANVVSGDVVKVYATNTSTTALGTATSTGTSVTVSIPQVGTAAGSVFVSLKNASKNESTRTAATYIAEPVTTAPVAADVTVTNNATGTNDTVVVANVVSGDVVKVYATSTSTTALGSATASGTTVTVTVPQLGASAGTIYVTKKNTSKHESPRTSVTLSAEPASTAPAVADITATNNPTGTADTVVVANVVSGDVVKVYATNTSTTALGTATSTGTSVTVSVPQFGTTAGSVYVTVKSSGKNESTRTAAAYSAEGVSTAPVAANITVTNSVTGTPDTVNVSGLSNGDIVRVYGTASSTTVLGVGVAGAGGAVLIAIPQIGTGAGSVHVSVQSPSKNESTRTSATVTAENTTTAPLAADITVVSAKAYDTITVANVASGDYIYVYSSASGGTLLAVGEATGTSITFNAVQLGAAGGTIYVSKKSTSKNESIRTAKTFAAE